jgi:hypothetical protein
MTIGNHPSFELSQSLFNLRQIQFHTALHSLVCRAIHVVLFGNEARH